jgi:hypothetical protein
MKAVRLGAKLASSILGGMGGTRLGEAMARTGYKLSGAKAPPSYEAPERGAGESIARIGGNIAGMAAGQAMRGTYASRLATSALGAVGGEELTAAIYNNVASRYGDRIASSIERWI